MCEFQSNEFFFYFYFFIFFIFLGGGEGPRSRCCRHTAALRLIVQPCDEDD
jgi:hypothetical protein